MECGPHRKGKHLAEGRHRDKGITDVWSNSRKSEWGSTCQNWQNSRGDQRDWGLTDGESGRQLDVPGAVVRPDQALPHVQQGVGVQSECCYVVNQHYVHAEALPPAVGQD